MPPIPQARPEASWGALATGALAAIGASACCVGPLVLVLLGVSGAWGARLAALTPYQPLFWLLAAAAFGLAFHRLYLRRRPCAATQACAKPDVLGRHRLLFWWVLIAALALIASPWLIPLFA